MCWAKSLRTWAKNHGVNHRDFSVEELLEMRRNLRSTDSRGFRTKLNRGSCDE